MSLYRKYRPQTFDDVVGQEHIAQTLRHALASDPIRVAHAYLFCGPRGTGKTTSARLLAKCLNCEQGPTPTPCNQCDFCTRVRDNQATMDLIEIDAASNTGVDNVRENIIERVNTAPAQGRYRVYIIDEVHMLSTSSFNALLKTLEEPPAHAVFVLATTDAHRVPATISSRCQRFDFRRVGPADIVARLQHVARLENIQLQDDAARLIATTADGALRDALTLLEQVSAFAPEAISQSDVRLVLGTVSQELMRELIDAVATQDALAALTAIERATEEGVSFSQLARDLTSYCRDLLLLTVGFGSDGALPDDERRQRSEHSRVMGRARLTACVEALRATEKEMRQSTDHRLLLELALVRLTSASAPAPADVAATQPAQSATGAIHAPALRPAVARPVSPSEVRAQGPQPGAPRPDRARDETPQSTLQQQPQPHTNGAARRPASGTANEDAAANVPTRNAVATDESSTEELEGDGSTSGSGINAPSDVMARTPVESLEAVESSESVSSAEAAPANEEPSFAAEANSESVDAEESSPDGASSDAAGSASDVAVAPARKKGRRIHTLEEFHELWPAVLARVKRKIGVSAVAYLHDAMPVALDSKEAVLQFKKEFHFEKACEAAKRLPFEQVVNECLATPHRLRFQMAPPPDSMLAAEAAPASPPDDDDDEDDVLRLAQDMFGAEVVGRSGAG